MSIELDDRGRALENEYFRRQEQELIQKMKAKLNAENVSASNLDCPKCDGKLVETDYENIKIDVCTNCTGVWLDAGELAQIAVREDDGGGWFSRFTK
jgi:uncharacterized protein with PIN domain